MAEMPPKFHSSFISFPHLPVKVIFPGVELYSSENIKISFITDCILLLLDMMIEIRKIFREYKISITGEGI